MLLYYIQDIITQLLSVDEKMLSPNIVERESVKREALYSTIFVSITSIAKALKRHDKLRFSSDNCDNDNG